MNRKAKHHLFSLPGICFSPSRRTYSPYGSDWESEAYGLQISISRKRRCLCSRIRNPYWTITNPYLAITNQYWFYPPFLPFSLAGPLFTGVHRREGQSFSLPSPSRPGSLVFKMWGSETKKGRVMGGIIILPPVPQTPCTSAFERGDGRKGG